MQLENHRKLVIAGGGTGGHVLAGVAIADAWKAQYGDQASVNFVGAQGGIEEKLVPRAGYPLTLLKLGSLNQVSYGRKLRTLFLLPMSLIRSAYFLVKIRPYAVLGVGGYASGPLVLVARLLRFLGLLGAKTAIIEQNSVPGLTNRILGKWVDRIFCAFPGMETVFEPNKVQLTGNPVRSSMKLLPAPPRKPFVVFIFGGSQGALGINSMVLESLPLFEDIKDEIQWIHQTGEKDYERVLAGHLKAGMKSRVEKFIHDMPEAYAKASLLVCRAGSSTLAEIAAVGRASVLVPFPFASDNHQEKNARVFVDAHAAFLLVQQNSNGMDLARIIRKSYLEPALLDQMEKNARSFYKPDAAKDIVAQLGK